MLFLSWGTWEIKMERGERWKLSTTQNQTTIALNIPAFWKAQRKDWRITVIRTSLERLGYKIILPYLTLYIILLGATKTQLGFVTSLGLIASGLIGPYIGQVIDRHGPKKVYIVGILDSSRGGYLAFQASAPVWQVAALGMFLHQLGGGGGGREPRRSSAVKNRLASSRTERKACLSASHWPPVF